MTFDQLKVSATAELRWCNKVINDAWKEGNLEAWTFNRGKAEAFSDLINMLAKVELDLSLKELKEFCENVDCEECPFAQFDENEDGIRFQCDCDLDVPKRYNIKEIENKIKKATNGR